MSRRALVVAAMIVLFVAGFLTACAYTGPSGGWSPYTGTEGDSSWTPYVPTVTGGAP